MDSTNISLKDFDEHIKKLFKKLPVAIKPEPALVLKIRNATLNSAIDGLTVDRVKETIAEAINGKANPQSHPVAAAISPGAKTASV
jgi:hypothetical protein